MTGGNRVALARILTLLFLLFGLFSADSLASSPAFPGAPGVGTLTQVGDLLPGARVETVETHPEFERYGLRLDDGRLLQVEAVEKSSRVSGVCGGEGVALQPRWELLSQEAPPGPLHPAVQALCERLPQVSRRFHFTPSSTSSSSSALPRIREPLPQGPLPWRPFQGVYLLLLGTLGAVILGAGRRQWTLLAPPDRLAFLGVILTSAGIRALLSPHRPFNGGGAAWEKLALSSGHQSFHPLYGEGWPSMMGPIQAVFGLHPDVVFNANLALGTLAAPLLWWGLRCQVSLRTATFSSLALALFPLHVSLSATEALHVSVVTFEVLAMGAALGWRARPGWSLALLASLSGGITVHIRPDAAPFLLLLTLPFMLPVPPSPSQSGRPLLPSRLLFAFVLFLLLAWRGVQAQDQMVQDVLHPSRMASPWFWVSALRPRFGDLSEGAVFQTFLSRAHSPPLWWGMALVGLLRFPRRWSGAVLLWVALVTLPVLTKTFPLADAMRLQLSSCLPWSVAVGMGLSFVSQQGRWGMGVALMILLSAIPVSFSLRHGWSHQEEWYFLRQAVPILPPGAVVRYPDATHRSEKFGTVMESLTQGRVPWHGLSSHPPVSGEFMYQGVSCHAEATRPGPEWVSGVESCRQVARICRMESFRESRIPARSDQDIRLPPGDLMIGLYRLSECGEKQGMRRGSNR